MLPSILVSSPMQFLPSSDRTRPPLEGQAQRPVRRPVGKHRSEQLIQSALPHGLSPGKTQNRIINGGRTLEVFSHQCFLGQCVPLGDTCQRRKILPLVFSALANATRQHTALWCERASMHEGPPKPKQGKRYSEAISVI